MKTVQLHAALQALTEKHNIFAPQEAWQCCQSCGMAAIPEGYAGAVFYHAQDAEKCAQSGFLYLSYTGMTLESALVAAAAIAEIAMQGGVTIWNGQTYTRLRITVSDMVQDEGLDEEGEDDGYAFPLGGALG